MKLLNKFKKKLKRKWMLQGKHSERFGLSGTRIYSDGSDIFENCTYECSGENNSIELKGRVNLNQSKIYISGKNNKIIFGKNSDIIDITICINGNENNILISNDSMSDKDKIRLKESTIFMIGKDNVLSISTGSFVANDTFWLQGDNNHIAVGKNFYSNGMNNYTCMDGAQLIIGDECLLSVNIVFQVGDGHSIYGETCERINKTKDVIIGNHVWIGKRVSVLKGTKICDESVIGQGAIVTKSFNESNVIIAGVPANIIKKNIRWEK